MEFPLFVIPAVSLTSFICFDFPTVYTTGSRDFFYVQIVLSNMCYGSVLCQCFAQDQE